MIFRLGRKTQEREREQRGRERKRIQLSFHDPRSSVGQNSLGQEPKFIISTRATCEYQKQRISSKIRRRIFGEIGFFGLKRCSRDLIRFYYALRGRDSSYLGLFLLLWIDFYLRGYLAWVKTTLIAVLRPVCGRFCVLICGCV